MDVKQAYHNIPVHPSDRACLGMSWEGMVYVDTVLPFGLRSAPLIFSVVVERDTTSNFARLKVQPQSQLQNTNCVSLLHFLPMKNYQKLPSSN